MPFYSEMTNLIGVIAIFINSLAIVFAFLYVQWQIRTMQVIENEKRIIAIQALIRELERNKEILLEYIDHWWIGGHSSLTLANGSGPTYDLQTPSFVNYEQFLPLACYDNDGLAKRITEIYLSCDACKILVNQVLNFVSNNQLNKNNSPKALDNYEKEIVKHNRQMCEISKDAFNLFDKAISGLIVLRESLLGKRIKGVSVDKKKIKRIIAREGLIIISLLAFYFINTWLGKRANTTGLSKGKIPLCFWGIPRTRTFDLDYIWYLVTQFSLFIAYPLYLIIRFILWAIRTLKER